MTSRVARKPITIPSGVEIKVNGQVVTVKGPKGQFTYHLPACVKAEYSDHLLTVAAYVDEKLHIRNRGSVHVLAGTARANLHNLVMGATQGYSKKLSLVGVGYRAQAQGKKLNLSLGFSHPTVFDVPAGITIETPSQTKIVILGADKQLVGQVAAKIRAIRSVEPYKGKGVRYSDEQVTLKETKKK